MAVLDKIAWAKVNCLMKSIQSVKLVIVVRYRYTDYDE